MRSGQGNPDEARSARYLLKDYVTGKLRYCSPPPGISEALFNNAMHQHSLRRASGKKRAPVTRVTRGADTFVPSNIPEPLAGNDSTLSAKGQGLTSRALDHAFFENNSALSSRPFIQGSVRPGETYSRLTIYPHQNVLADDGTPLNRAHIRVEDGKKHHKKMQRQKQRSGKGYD